MTVAPKTFRKRPVVVQAMQWNGGAEAATPVIDWILSGGGTARYVGQGELHHLRRGDEVVPLRTISTVELLPTLPTAPEFIVIDTLEGAHRMDPGNVAICGVMGEHYACRGDIFATTYEPVEDGVA